MKVVFLLSLISYAELQKVNKSLKSGKFAKFLAGAGFRQDLGKSYILVRAEFLYNVYFV